MGRNKIKIEYIQHPQNRKVTFRKRWNGLKRKIKQLSVLSGCEVFVLIKPLGASSDPETFLELSSRQPAESLVLEYLQAHQERQVQRIPFETISKDDDDDDEPLTPTFPNSSPASFPLPTPLVLPNTPNEYAFSDPIPLLYQPPQHEVYPEFNTPQYFFGQW
ncbi:hypothetical protein HMI54_002327 [Coelomomyces lativittatus]|nr:hypothetical protein HMI56_007591 [Coelomomyces lativittatus]KAJ1509484.1 hypothetical protein HMI54_002327 [Coelomomyces lativittatus]KAJ1516857.1 hypothetical protein HMI55_001217 [Coelomomyces lativittatus]